MATARALSSKVDLNENYGQIPTRLLVAQVKHLYFSNFGILSRFSGLHCE